MTYEFTIFSPLAPVELGIVFIVLAVLTVIWIWKWIPSIGTGAGGS